MDDKKPDNESGLSLSRRGFIGASVATGVAGVAGTAGLAGITGLSSAVMSPEAFAKAAEDAVASAQVHPGELDEYYGFWKSDMEARNNNPTLNS